MLTVTKTSVKREERVLVAQPYGRHRESTGSWPGRGLACRRRSSWGRQSSTGWQPSLEVILKVQILPVCALTGSAGQQPLLAVRVCEGIIHRDKYLFLSNWWTPRQILQVRGIPALTNTLMPGWGGAELSSNLCLDVCLLSVRIFLVFCISYLCSRAVEYLLSSCLGVSSSIQETLKNRNSKPECSKNFQNERCKSHK